MNFAGDESAPAAVNGLWISVDHYGTHVERLASRGICERLEMDWAIKACFGNLSDDGNPIPRRFELFSQQDMTPADRRSAGSNQSFLDRLSDALPLTQDPLLVCSEDKVFCYGVVTISDDIVAVWDAKCRRDADDTCLNRIKDEAIALRQFVLTDLVRDPGSGPG